MPGSLSWLAMQLFPKQAPFTTPRTSGSHSMPPAAVLPQLDSTTALFLDFDGTLVDISEQPELVHVPIDLGSILQQLAASLNGALAIVSGRALMDLDHFMSPLVLPLAAEHGSVQRFADGHIAQLARPELRDVERVALALAGQHAGLRVEIKSAAVALHYRHAPALEVLCIEEMAEVVKRTPGVELMKGKCVVEIKAAGVSKGTAIQDFMTQPPFAGRLPVFAGDDTTDESAFAAVQAMGGAGIKVGHGDSLARFRCSNPAQLRRWLQTGFERACP